MAEHPHCAVAMGARGGAHHGAREPVRVGHAVQLIAPHFVKPLIKRQRNDAPDREAIAEAALRPTLRLVKPKTRDHQARFIVFRIRVQVVKQRTKAVNALRSHQYGFGFIAPVGIGCLPRLGAVREDPNSDLPPLAREICRELLDQIVHLTARINALQRRIDAIAKKGDILPPSNDAGRKPDQRLGRRDLCATDGAVQTRPRLRGLAFSGPSASLDRRQAVARENLEDGPARQSPSLDHRRDGRDPPGAAPWRTEQSVAGECGNASR
jgi:hypothetical protein